MHALACDLPGRACPIYIGRRVVHEIESRFPALFEADRVALVADETVHALHADTLMPHLPRETAVIIVPPGEREKNIERLKQLLNQFLEAGLTRRSAVVAFGGGVVSDLAGFAAAVYMRGIDYYNVPTTLLAQADSAIGGKVGVNLPQGKNLAGAFHQPRGVLADTALLDTLPNEEYRQGIAEIIKCGLIRYEKLFAHMESSADAVLERGEQALLEAVRSAVAVKIAFVEADEREHGVRAILNFGHTFAHAFEQAGEYLSIRHGDAVAAGMVAAALLGTRLGITDDALVTRLEDVLKKYSLPTRFPKSDEDAIIEALLRDKKHASGKLRFILPLAIGQAEINEGVTIEDVRGMLPEIMK